MDARLRRVAGAVAATLVLLVGAPAVADVPPEAIELMSEGAEQYQAGDYDRAAVTFRRAFEVHPDARFLFNAARASQRGDNPRQAYNYYQRALEVDGQERRLDAGDQAVALGFVNAIQRQEQAVDLGSKLTEPQPEVPSEPSGWSRQSRIGASTAAAGGLMLAGAMVSGWRAGAGLDELATEGVDSPGSFEDRMQSIERTQLVGQWSLYMGTAFVAAGAALVAWDLLGDDAPLSGAAVGIGDDGVWASWEVRFD